MLRLFLCGTLLVLLNAPKYFSKLLDTLWNSMAPLSATDAPHTALPKPLKPPEISQTSWNWRVSRPLKAPRTLREPHLIPLKRYRSSLKPAETLPKRFKTSWIFTKIPRKVVSPIKVSWNPLVPPETENKHPEDSQKMLRSIIHTSHRIAPENQRRFPEFKMASSTKTRKKKLKKIPTKSQEHPQKISKIKRRWISLEPHRSQQIS